jgi:pyruvate/2-oxoglutarate dehydrogenase complex dihydrolipoamide dehydrogenase (E3) component
LNNQLKSVRYDALIIGAGQGGVPLAIELANAGWKTALIEGNKVGGSCINYGCTPTKTMVASARVAYLAERGKEYGIKSSGLKIDMKAIRDRKRNMVESFRSSSEKNIKDSKNLDFYHGVAQFTGPGEIKVNMVDGKKRNLRADKIFIDTGSRPATPSIDGIENIEFLDSTSIMELDSVPDHLIIVGGGYIGLEFGQMFRRFGSKVTIIHRGKQLLSREDGDISAEVAKILKEDGIDVLLNAKPVNVKRLNRDEISISLKFSDKDKRIEGSHLLVATGRIPNTEMLNLDSAGIEYDDRGFIKSSSRLETSVEGVYVIGDIKGGPAFTHISYDDYRILKANIIDGKNVTIDNRMIPYTVFIDPQLGRVGLNETQAKAKGYNFKIAKIPMSYVARALETDESRGLMKAVIDMDTEKILGCAILGIEGGEIMNMIQIAMMGDLPYTALRDAVFAHPTLGESLNTLFASIES